MAVMEAATLAEAVTLANQSKYGNGCSLFTRDGGAAEYFRKHIECGMIGINAGVPAPMAFLSFGGTQAKLFRRLAHPGARQRRVLHPKEIGDHPLARSEIRLHLGQVIRLPVQ